MTNRSSKKESLLLGRWLKSLVKWVRSFFKQPDVSSSSIIIKTIKSEDGKSLLLDLKRDDIGAVRTIRINSTALADKSFLITVDNLLVLNREEKRRRNNSYSGSKRAKAATHRIAVSIVVVAGKHAPDFIGIWDANLIRFGVSDEDAGAARIAYVLGLRLLMSLGEFYDLELVSVFKAIWWEERLLSILSNDFGPYHIANLTRVK